MSDVTVWMGQCNHVEVMCEFVRQEHRPVHEEHGELVQIVVLQKVMKVVVIV